MQHWNVEKWVKAAGYRVQNITHKVQYKYNTYNAKMQIQYCVINEVSKKMKATVASVVTVISKLKFNVITCLHFCVLAVHCWDKAVHLSELTGYYVIEARTVHGVHYEEKSR